MKNKTMIVLFAMMITAFAGCKKDAGATGWVQAYIDIPFEMAPTQRCYLLDTIIDSNTGQRKTDRVELKINSIEDGRAFGLECSSVYGTSAKVKGAASLNSSQEVVYDFYMPGCTNGGEWTVANTNIPKVELGRYIIYLLKLSPHDAKPKSIGGYRVKYIVKIK